jgi:hypothetical protein
MMNRLELIAELKKEMGYTDNKDCCKCCCYFKPKIEQSDFMIGGAPSVPRPDRCGYNIFTFPVDPGGRCPNFNRIMPTLQDIHSGK